LDNIENAMIRDKRGVTSIDDKMIEAKFK